MTFQWTHREINRLAALLEEGKTAAEIGLALGVSRNAIIGKVRRVSKLSAIGFARGKGQHRNVPLVGVEKHAGRTASRKPAPKPAKMPATVATQSVEAWLEANGGPRRFELGASNDMHAIKDYLRERGYEVLFDHRGRRLGAKVKAGRGRPRKYTYSELVALVDQYRIADGLEPITPPERAAGRAA